MSYLFREREATSLEPDFAPHMERAAILTLELSTGSVETMIEIPAFSPMGFIGNVAGNLGMFFGTALYNLAFELCSTGN